MEKNGGFWGRAVGSEVCATSALSIAVVYVDVREKTGGFQVCGVSAFPKADADGDVWEKNGGFWGSEVRAASALAQRLCGFGAASVLVWTLHCQKQMSMTQCVT